MAVLLRLSIGKGSWDRTWGNCVFLFVCFFKPKYACVYVASWSICQRERKCDCVKQQQQKSSSSSCPLPLPPHFMEVSDCWYFSIVFLRVVTSNPANNARTDQGTNWDPGRGPDPGSSWVPLPAGSCLVCAAGLHYCTQIPVCLSLAVGCYTYARFFFSLCCVGLKAGKSRIPGHFCVNMTINLIVSV